MSGFGGLDLFFICTIKIIHVYTTNKQKASRNKTESQDLETARNTFIRTLQPFKSARATDALQIFQKSPKFPVATVWTSEVQSETCPADEPPLRLSC